MNRNLGRRRNLAVKEMWKLTKLMSFDLVKFNKNRSVEIVGLNLKATDVEIKKREVLFFLLTWIGFNLNNINSVSLSKWSFEESEVKNLCVLICIYEFYFWLTFLLLSDHATRLQNSSDKLFYYFQNIEMWQFYLIWDKLVLYNLNWEGVY